MSAARRWPVADPELARREELEIPIQVNGKLRSRVIAAPDVSEETSVAALADERVGASMVAKLKVIVVPASRKHRDTLNDCRAALRGRPSVESRVRSGNVRQCRYIRGLQSSAKP